MIKRKTSTSVLKEKNYLLKEKKNRKEKSREYKCIHYNECPYKQQYSSNKKGRTIEVSPYAEVVDKQRRKQKLDAYKTMLSKRKEIIEHVFGIMKFIMGFNRWTVRGLENVKAQWYYLCTMYNLKKIYQIWLTIGSLKPEKAGIQQ